VEGLAPHLRDVVEQAAEGPVRGDEKRADAVEVVVLKVDKGEQEDSSVQAAPLEPVGRAPAPAPEVLDVEGVVKNVADFGRLRRRREDIDGLVHVSRPSWNTRVKNPSELFRRGTSVRAKVLISTPRAQKFSLGSSSSGRTRGRGSRSGSERATCVTGKRDRA